MIIIFVGFRKIFKKICKVEIKLVFIEELFVMNIKFVLLMCFFLNRLNL